jgi:hypothetical protein
LKHGLRAKEVIIPGQEDPAEFEVIMRELCDDWEPDGHMEVHLVEQIGLAEWRLRRTRRAELGEIRTQIPSSTLNFNDVEKQIEEAAKLSPHTLQKILAESTLGILCLRKAVENALDELESEGTVSEETCLRLQRLFGDQRDSPATILNTLFFEEMPEGKMTIWKVTANRRRTRPDLTRRQLRASTWRWCSRISIAGRERCARRREPISR